MRDCLLVFSSNELHELRKGGVFNINDIEPKDRHSSNDKRELWVDIAKTITIYLIVFGHLINNNFICSFLWTFHVPVFFFLSGFLAKHDVPFLHFLKKLINRLVIPYFALYLCCMLIKLAYDHASISTIDIINMITAMFAGSHAYAGFVSTPLWFLPSLITVQLLFYVSYRFRALYLLLIIISLWFYYHHMINLFMSIDLSLLGINYFVLGVIGRHFAGLIRADRLNTLYPIFFCVSITIITDLAVHGNVWYTGNSYVLSLAGGIVGVIGMISFCKIITLGIVGPLKIIIQFISENTLFILAFHSFSNILVLKAFKLLWPGEVGGSLIAACVAICSIMVLVPPNLFVVRVMPWIVGARR